MKSFYVKITNCITLRLDLTRSMNVVAENYSCPCWSIKPVQATGPGLKVKIHNHHGAAVGSNVKHSLSLPPHTLPLPRARARPRPPLAGTVSVSLSFTLLAVGCPSRCRKLLWNSESFQSAVLLHMYSEKYRNNHHVQTVIFRKLQHEHKLAMMFFFQ
jgi:hypothetical protein